MMTDKQKYIEAGPVEAELASMIRCHSGVIRDVLKGELALIRSQPAADVRPAVRAHAVRFYNDPQTGRMFTTCGACDKKIGPKDCFCKHCGAEILKVEHDSGGA